MNLEKSNPDISNIELIDTQEPLAREIIQFISLKNYCYLIECTEHSLTSGLYEISAYGAKYSNDTVIIFEQFCDRIKALFKRNGILLICLESGKKPTFKFISHYNPELFTIDVFELILFKEYNIEPCDEERKQVLQQSIKAEKIKDTLVYACYENNTDKIMECLRQAKQSQLNKKLKYVGTPLGICAKNNNIVAFKAIVESGATLGKVSLVDTPLAIAFTYSPDIVKYIYTNFRDQFGKEVLIKGFSLALHTKDVGLLQLLFDYGCDINCEGKPFPPLHNFADFNNVVGLKFLLDNGANVNVKNQYKQTPIDRAKARNNQEAINILRSYYALEK
ncbi:hypothetical protein SRRS_45480 [Sporomusa rhizae]|uniref:ankyrin repeat domain-containing protein n=1 Tax=Sporomusa rhizae TaxID=357999 RepID=UPI003529FBB6